MEEDENVGVLISGVCLVLALTSLAIMYVFEKDNLDQRERQAISRGYATYDSNGQFTWREQR